MSSDSFATGDDLLAEAIQAKIEARMPPGAPPIDVAVQGANVTITGYVPNQRYKDAVIRTVRETEGVINVVDNLEFGHGHPFKDWAFPWSNPNEDLEKDSRGEW